jgi:Zn-dependent M28 family amino/carboxypeptidase
MKLLALLLFFANIQCMEPTVTFAALKADPDSLYKHVAALVKTPKPRHYSNQASLETAADYIFAHFDSLGLNPQNQWFDVGGQRYRNIIASYGNTSLPRIIIGAHYDVYDELPGADDNASGVAGVLEVARLAQNLSVPVHLEFVAYALEEPPFFGTKDMGSYYHAERLVRENVPVDYMVCLEMIGYFSDQEHSQEYPLAILRWFLPDTGDFIAAIGNNSSRFVTSQYRDALENATSMQCVTFNTFSSLVPGADFSDHRNYWHFGMPAIMITDTAFMRNKNYHSEDDTIDTLDFERMAMVVTGVMHMLNRAR